MAVPLTRSPSSNTTRTKIPIETLRVIDIESHAYYYKLTIQLPPDHVGNLEIHSIPHARIILMKVRVLEVRDHFIFLKRSSIIKWYQINLPHHITWKSDGGVVPYEQLENTIIVLLPKRYIRSGDEKKHYDALLESR